LKSGVVVWSSEYRSDENISVEKKIKALFGKFTNDISVWKLPTENLKADIFCGVFLDDWNRGFSLTSRLMKELSDRNLELGFDIYSPTNTRDKE
jgi:hypothetical protein